MGGLFGRGDRLERELRSRRPRPADELVSRIEARLHAEAPEVRRNSSRARLVPVAFTAAAAVALAAVGGIGYAASSVEHAALTVSHVFMRAQVHEPVIVRSLSSGADQYRPGYGWGDRNHVHTGPPGLKHKGGKIHGKKSGSFFIVNASFTLDEQAHLWISVVDGKGKGVTQFVIDQKRSTVGQGLKGRSAKVINYLVLVPRTITLRLAVPSGLLVSGHTYYIRIIAQSPLGNKSTIYIPFTR